LPVCGGPVAQSQSHANVAAWLAAQAHIPAGAPPLAPAPPSQVLGGAATSHHGAASTSAVGGVAVPEREADLSSEQQQEQNMMLTSLLREVDSQQHQQLQQPNAHQEQRQHLVEYIVRELQQQQQQRQNPGAAVVAAAEDVLDGSGGRPSRGSASSHRPESYATDGADGQEADGEADPGDLAMETSRARRAQSYVGSIHECDEQFVKLTEFGQIAASGSSQDSATDQPGPPSVTEAEAEAE
ncbi:hypothetical protein Vafri_9691, partial [Volvox africanus]